MLKRFRAIGGCCALLALSACSISGHPHAAIATATTGIAFGAASPAATRAPHQAAGKSHPRSAAPVTITAVGDMMLGDTPDLPPDPAAYFDQVKSILDPGGPGAPAAGIVFGNLEGTLTTAATSKCGKGKHPDCFAFHDPPGYARYYKEAGFTVLNDANNHSFDFGAAGQAQTVQAIHAAGLAQTGLPGEITVVKAKGVKAKGVKAKGVKVAFLAFAPYDYDAELLNLPAARALITRAGKMANIVVVYMHAGAEGRSADHVTGREEIYLGEDRGNPEAFAHMAIDAGASLVIASGPHVLRGMQFYKGHLIAYSLGNFAGYDNFGTNGDLATSMILRVTLSSAGRFERARIYPVLDAGQGRPEPGGGAIAFVAGLSSADFGSTAARIAPTGIIKAP